MVTVTSARPSGARDEVPAKMTSSIFPPRSVLAPCSPITHARASTTLDLPEPLGPTTAVMPGSKRRVVGDAKDLKPFSVRLLRYTARQTTGQIAPAPLTEGCRLARNLPAVHTLTHWPQGPHQSLKGRVSAPRNRRTSRLAPTNPRRPCRRARACRHLPATAAVSRPPR